MRASNTLLARISKVTGMTSLLLATAVFALALVFAATPTSTAAADESVRVAGLLDLLRQRLEKKDDEEEEETKKEKKKPQQKKKRTKENTVTWKKKKTPSNARLRIAVIGDSLAQDLWFGMRRVLIRHKDIEVVRFTKSASGLVRDDSYDWAKKLTSFVAEERFEIAVVLFGGNDRQGIRLGGKRLPRFTKKWTVEYGRRVDAVIDLLKTRTQTIFWVGLPVVRSSSLERDYKKLNVIYRSRAEAGSIEFIDIWHLFRDDSGVYTSFGPDLRGTKRKLRMDDGNHFTAPGQARFAHEVVKIMRTKVELSSTEQLKIHALLSAPAKSDCALFAPASQYGHNCSHKRLE